MECKLPGGHLTELQKRALKKISVAGGYAYRVESADDAKKIIEKVDADIARGFAKNKNIEPDLNP